MRVDDVYRKCVVFLGHRDVKNGKEFLHLGATAFVACLPFGKNRGAWPYLITAKHATDELAGFKFEIRYNTNTGTYATREYKANTKWWTHPTEEDSVDVAVMPFTVPTDSDIMHLPIEQPFWLTKAELERVDIGAGDEIFLTGLFTKLTGEEKNIPIVRSGNVAMIPDEGEKIPDVEIGKYRGPIEGYLIEARSIGGLSGSPVFVRETIRQVNIPIIRRSGDVDHGISYRLGPQHFLGLMHGHWEIYPEQKNKVKFQTTKRNRETVNLGIGIVIPAYKILEVINHPELKAMRQKREKKIIEKEGSTTSDSDFGLPLSKDDFEKALKKVSRKLPSQPEESCEPSQEKP